MAVKKKLPLYHPAVLIATCFGLGRWRSVTPDVSGSLLAILVILFFYPNLKASGELLTFSAGVLVVGWVACGFYFQRRKDKDISEIAIDGFIGMLASVVFFYFVHDYVSVYPLTGNRIYALFLGQPYFTLAALFLLFRFFHGWRIGFARITSTGIRSSTGIIMEALSAALMASLLLHGFIILSEYIQRPGVW